MTIQASQFGDYIIEDELGRGTMGVVYHARHELTHRDVALKVLFPNVSGTEVGEARFRREARVSAMVDDAGIVEVFDAGKENGSFYYAMELLDGRELADVLAEIDLRRGLQVLRDVAGSLGPCHDAGIVHRDLKPANIFVSPTEEEEGGRLETKILDFGIASVREAPRATQTGYTLGTPCFMSPEQARDASAVSPASDIWSIGIILYELVAGHLPFDGDSSTNVLIEVAQADVPPLEPDEPVPPSLIDIVDRCLAKDPDDRFEDAAALRDALDAVIEELEDWDPAEAAPQATSTTDAAEPEATDEPAVESMQTSRRQKVLAATAAAAAVVALAAAAAFVFLPEPDADVEPSARPSESASSGGSESDAPATASQHPAESEARSEDATAPSLRRAHRAVAGARAAGLVATAAAEGRRKLRQQERKPGAGTDRDDGARPRQAARGLEDPSTDSNPQPGRGAPASGEDEGARPAQEEPPKSADKGGSSDGDAPGPDDASPRDRTQGDTSPTDETTTAETSPSTAPSNSDAPDSEPADTPGPTSPDLPELETETSSDDDASAQNEPTDDTKSKSGESKRAESKKTEGSEDPKPDNADAPADIDDGQKKKSPDKPDFFSF